jgi:uncharacterized membrane protein YdjX (TVP38/TMEM64 family)
MTLLPARFTRFLPTGRQWLWLIIAILVIGGAVGWLLASGFDWKVIPRALAELNMALVLVVTAILPLVGFPISIVYLVIGARFGPAMGLAVVAGITVVHLLGTHWITRSFLRDPLLRFIERRGHRVPPVPEGENTVVAVMIMMAPGIPYFLRNFTLALSGVPLRVYLPVALPFHLLRSCVTLFVGDLGGSPSRGGAKLVVIIYTVRLGIFLALAWWLRRRHLRKKAATAEKLK